ncbi:MAG: reverse transcriptase/maturase family protein [Patescibacteria group bacterium]
MEKEGKKISNGVNDFTLEDLFKAYYDCRKNKRNTINALKFEANLERNMVQLYHELKNGVYQVGRSICFVIKHPKIREIWAADFRDRIVHHLVCNFIREKFEKSFIFDTYSCIKNKGTLAACRRLEKFTRSITDNYQRPAYFLKADVQSFFVSLDKNILWQIILKKVREKWIINLLKKIIFNDPRENYILKCGQAELDSVPKHKSLWYTPKNKGLPIGNLTSQFFSNIYLNELDHFIKRQLKCRYYVRYVDDIVILDKDPKRLNYLFDKINEFLRVELSLNLHSDKKEINLTARGINFVGFIIKPYRTYIRNSTVARIKQVIRSMPSAECLNSKLKKYCASLNSYFGMFRHISGYKLRQTIGQKIKNKTIFPVNDFRKFRLVDNTVVKTTVFDVLK